MPIVVTRFVALHCVLACFPRIITDSSHRADATLRMWIYCYMIDRLMRRLCAPGIERRPAHLQAFLPARPDLRAPLLVVALEPQRYAVLVASDGHHRAANLVSVQVQRLADDRQHGEEPPLVDLAAERVLLGHGEHELAAVLVGRVLPHGDHALAEDVVVAADGQLVGRLEVVEDPPEVLHGVEGAAVDQVVLPRLAVVDHLGVVEPDGPLGIQRDGPLFDFLADGGSQRRHASRVLRVYIYVCMCVEMGKCEGVGMRLFASFGGLRLRSV
eukprot:CAMPEP_0119553910 /NCGR_PEP_ID=MMETSP1352-20130426/6528_1 /TAXON_ID=265584 /ORGANISM="Stauroneis constricta, Strain CCMP1120" /LENGTH=270 /DNA_ID=CAMNT_0007600393 /DNA_START=263 /DNA_END=1072 /DNA_ORIENTATION=-